MLSFLHHNWALFNVLLGLALLITFFMSVQSLNFFTNDVVISRFSIIDLELPATAQEVVNLIKGLYKLPDDQSKKTIVALRGQLYVDFLFMPFAYLGVFLLCRLIANKMQLPFGYYVFTVLGWLQLVAWLLDIVENIYLLSKIRPDVSVSGKGVHKAYLVMVSLKWGIALTGIVFSISALSYFWLSGIYLHRSLKYLLLAAAEILVFLTSQKLFLKEKALPVMK